jgi:hypothetical protein
MTFEVINGVYVPRLRGGRGSVVMKDKKRYTRKTKHKNKEKLV